MKEPINTKELMINNQNCGLAVKKMQNPDWDEKFNDGDLISTYFYRPTLVGLANIGAPYYMNAILQCFCQIEEFASYFKFNRYVNYISNNYEKLGKNCLSKSFKILIDNIWPITLHNKINNSNNVIYSPVEFKEKIFKMSNLMNKTSVNDIKDFINLILITLHEELNKKTLNNNINNNIIQNTSNFYEAFQCFYSDFQNNYCSKISELFYGIQMTETTCLNCNSSQYNFQTYFSLIFSLKKVQKYALNKYQFQKQFLLNSNNSYNNMNINQINLKILNLANNIVNIFDCFDYSQKIDTLLKDNSIYCTGCCQLSQADYSTKLYNLPKILILIFDRENKNQNIKLDFPIQFDLNSYSLDKNNNNQYKLIGIVDYIIINNQNSFFIAHCLSPIDNNWYTYKDDNVNQVFNFKNQIYDEGMPCLLIYKRIG